MVFAILLGYPVSFFRDFALSSSEALKTTRELHKDHYIIKQYLNNPETL